MRVRLVGRRSEAIREYYLARDHDGLSYISNAPYDEPVKAACSNATQAKRRTNVARPLEDAPKAAGYLAIAQRIVRAFPVGCPRLVC